MGAGTGGNPSWGEEVGESQFHSWFLGLREEQLLRVLLPERGRRAPPPAAAIVPLQCCLRGQQMPTWQLPVLCSSRAGLFLRGSHRPAMGAL